MFRSQRKLGFGIGYHGMSHRSYRGVVVAKKVNGNGGMVGNDRQGSQRINGGVPSELVAPAIARDRDKHALIMPSSQGNIRGCIEMQKLGEARVVRIAKYEETDAATKN